MDKNMSRVIIAVLVAGALFYVIYHYSSKNQPIQNSGSVTLQKLQNLAKIFLLAKLLNKTQVMQWLMDPRDGNGTSEIESASASEPNVVDHQNLVSIQWIQITKDDGVDVFWAYYLHRNYFHKIIAQPGLKLIPKVRVH